MKQTQSWRSRRLAVALLVALPLSAAAEAEAESEKPKHHEADSEPATGKAKENPKDESEPKGIFDKSLKLKGTGITLQFGGFAKVDFIQDFDPIGNDSQFKTNTIPVEGDPEAELGGSNNIQAKQTRLTLDVRGRHFSGPGARLRRRRLLR